MAFVFKVEDGTGFTDSTSYVSVAEALTLLTTDVSRFKTFSCRNQRDQELYLSSASTYLDFRYQWIGNKTVNNSALRWPRTHATDRDGIAIGSNVIPRELKHAVALTAELLASETISQSSQASETSSFPLDSIKVDVIEIDFQVPVDERDVIIQVPNEVDLLLTGLGITKSSEVKFVKINK